MLRILGALASLALVAVGAWGQNSMDIGDVPAEKAGLLLYYSEPLASKVWAIEGAQGETLDVVGLSEGAPFARAYWLPPGEYDLYVTGDTPVRLNVIPGEIIYVKMTPSSADLVQRGGDQRSELDEILGQLREAGEVVAPVQIEPSDQELHVRLMPPGVKPPPPPQE